MLVQRRVPPLWDWLLVLPLWATLWVPPCLVQPRAQLLLDWLLALQW